MFTGWLWRARASLGALGDDLRVVYRASSSLWPPADSETINALERTRHQCDSVHYPLAMPALLPVTNGLRIVFNGLLSGTPTATVMHARWGGTVASPPTQADLDAIATYWRSAWAANFLLRQSSSDFLLGTVTVQDLSSNTGLMGSAAGSTAGSRAGLSLPANVAMVVSWRTALHFRGGHCRTYIPGMVQADQAGATSWATASISSMLGEATAFRTAVNAVTAGRLTSLCMLSRQSAGVVRPVPLLQDVTGETIDTRIDSMRRRLGKDR
jgi:hypothetical protein